MSSSGTVLITGATGFIGAHVLKQALDAGYAVKATARPAKVAGLQELYKGKAVEVFAIEDLATGDYTDALKDVTSILHIAAPIPGKADQTGFMSGAIEGALNIIRQGAKAGIKKVVMTSSYVTAKNIDNPGQDVSNHRYTVHDWNPVTREGAMDGTHDDIYVYFAAKAIAEREVWKFAAEHPDIDFTLINPVYVYGPFAPGFIIRKGDAGSLSTNGIFYQSVLPAKKTKLPAIQGPIAPLTVDVRDVAKAHILALQSTYPAKYEDGSGNKRILFAGPNFTWKDAADYLAATRPELKARLPDTSEVIDHPIATVDTSLAQEILGFGEFIDWKKTVDDTVDSLLEVERQWSA